MFNYRIFINKMKITATPPTHTDLTLSMCHTQKIHWTNQILWATNENSAMVLKIRQHIRQNISIRMNHRKAVSIFSRNMVRLRFNHRRRHTIFAPASKSSKFATTKSLAVLVMVAINFSSNRHRRRCSHNSPHSRHTAPQRNLSVVDGISIANSCRQLQQSSVHQQQQ